MSPRSRRTFNYYYENLSAIPDIRRYDVIDFHKKRRIGTLDQEFVSRRCSPTGGTVFIMHGQTWKIISIDEAKMRVDVEPTAPTLDAVPSWEGK